MDCCENKNILIEKKEIFFCTNCATIFERFIQLGKHVKIAINISITVDYYNTWIFLDRI